MSLQLKPKKVNNYRQVWLTLKELGYDVIPVFSGKDNPPAGYPTMPNTPADIQTWKGRGAAIRMFGNEVFIIDLDTCTEDARDAVLGMIKERWPDFFSRCLMRHSGAVKIALIGRCVTDIPKLHTHSYFTDPEMLDKTTKNLVEIFTSSSATNRYVVVHGAHSPGREYGYDGPSILNTPIGDLPEFPAEDIYSLIDACDEVMSALPEMHKRVGSAHTRGVVSIQYDLTPDMVFKISDREEVPLAELESRAKHERIEGYATLFDPGTRTGDRIKVNMSRDGLALYDTKDEVSHRWADRAPVDATTFADALKAVAVAHGIKLPKTAPNWRERFVGSGMPKPSYHNAELAVENEGIRCSEDVFHNKMFMGLGETASHPLPPFVGEMTDARIGLLRNHLSKQYGLDFTETHVRDAVVVMAHKNYFNPVVEMLAEAEKNWDKQKRLDHMAVEYFNTEDTEYASACLRKTMIASVARARNPGCKFDTILVLESVEGWNKSSAWMVLAGEGNFSDEHIIGKNSREVQEQLAGVWWHENADLAGMRKMEIETVKAYTSRVEDRARPAYGRFLVVQPRHSVEVGTTNATKYLLSQTGNRRFWPLRVLRPIDLSRLRAARLQLLGEAAHYQSQGESLTLDERLWPAATVEQEARRVVHAWEAVLADMQIIPVSGPMSGAGIVGNFVVHRIGDEDRVSTRDILEHVLKIPPAQMMHGSITVIIAEIMRRQGWTYATTRVEGKQVRGYVRQVQKVF
jgi:Virulence-associated protein E-like domain